MPTFVMKERPSGAKINFAIDVYKKMKALANADQENYWILGLDTANREILRKCLFTGSMRGISLDFVILFRRLLEVGAAAWIGLHNHPSGSLVPSDADRKLHEQLNAASNLIKITMHDSMIISENGYFSFQEEKSIGCGERTFD